MADVVDNATRRRMMSGIRGKDTKPELQIRKALHAQGFRFRLHNKGLPGKPDLVFPRYRTVLFVHGCFWHGHLCDIFKWPKTNQEFWRNKIEGNQKRDALVREQLGTLGWHQITIWECQIRRSIKSGQFDDLAKGLAQQIRG